ncbi:interferon-induced GTP-binding protein Mx2 [Xylariaceae sp. AK1471]|nr:interferon-induced GTP-binding protein Mx2 [Xylariaceae sp. AK1471]
MGVDEPGLGNQAVLTKINKLRELNLVVAVDQSSGKSSVLESLIDFAFTRATGLCTRHATQITYRREARNSVSVSIIPRPQADEVLKTELRKFRRSLSSLNNDDLATIFQEGIRMDTADNQTHFTVINDPSIFQVPTPGLTTESDVTLAQNRVKTYTHNRRTISTADPDDVTTMGVLTEPDFATEKSTKDAVVDLVLSKRNPLKLGCCVAFFMCRPWLTIADRCGVTSLQGRLRELLMNIPKREFPRVKLVIKKRLREFRAKLEAISPSNASRFQSVTECVLNRYCSGDHIFATAPDLKLATKIIELNKTLSNVAWRRGREQNFEAECDEYSEASSRSSSEEPPFKSFCLQEYKCPKPLKGPIDDRIEKIFNETIIATAFREQSEKWEPLALSHSSNAIVLVHAYIYQLLTLVYPEKQVRDQLWDRILVDKLRVAYHRAMNQARFLLATEREGGPTTLNHYFNANLQKKRAERVLKAFKTMSVPVSKLEQAAVNKDNVKHTCEDIVHVLTSYYKVSRKRFVDATCQQVMNRFLLDDGESPLKILGMDRIMNLNAEQLEVITGEDAAAKHQRQTLGSEIEALEAALKVLRPENNNRTVFKQDH